MTDNLLTLFCLVDGDSIPFSVDINASKPVDHLKNLIVNGDQAPAFRDLAAKDLILWRVSIPVVPKKQRREISLADIPSKEELDEMDDLSEVFEGTPPKKTIHIIVQRPPPAVQAPVPARVVTAPSDEIRPGSPVSGIMDVINQIQGTFHPRSPRSDSARQVSSIMPWQERPMDAAIDRVVENVSTCLSWQSDQLPAKAESSFLVCSGAAGIGKTRYGRELFDTLRHRLSEKAKAKGVDYSPHYHYMLLDFGIDAKLGPIDTRLDADTVLGLRLAYTHFFQDRYDEGFLDFCYRAVDYRGLFTISNVIIAIRQDLKQPAHQPFFLFLHIDEFQRIFDHRWEETPKGHKLASLPNTGFRLAGDTTERHTNEGVRLFQDMMRSLGPFMSGAIKPHMIQTFLSGTARQDVTLAAEPTSYSFKFLSCPTLSTGACYDIMGHFTGLAKVPHRQWMPKMAFLHLLSATGGLPRALQLLLEEFFGRRLEKCNTFADTAEDINMNAD
ncbi:hypothetical protein BGX24_006147, partial [Mortierella sp. AD032]